MRSAHKSLDIPLTNKAVPLAAVLVNMGSVDTTGSIPEYIAEGLTKQDIAALRVIAEQARELADPKEAERTLAEDEPDEEELEDAPELPDDERDAPSRATKTKKTIKGNDYWYYQ